MLLHTTASTWPWPYLVDPDRHNAVCTWRDGKSQVTYKWQLLDRVKIYLYELKSLNDMLLRKTSAARSIYFGYKPNDVQLVNRFVTYHDANTTLRSINILVLLSVHYQAKTETRTCKIVKLTDWKTVYANVEHVYVRSLDKPVFMGSHRFSVSRALNHCWRYNRGRGRWGRGWNGWFCYRHWRYLPTYSCHIEVTRTKRKWSRAWFSYTIEYP